VPEISEEQLQELTDLIADKCEAMELEPEQILDGIARSLIAAATTFGTQSFQVDVECHGSCMIKLIEEAK
jgi:hypothetical protein